MHHHLIEMVKEVRKGLFSGCCHWLFFHVRSVYNNKSETFEYLMSFIYDKFFIKLGSVKKYVTINHVHVHTFEYLISLNVINFS